MSKQNNKRPRTVITGPSKKRKIISNAPLPSKRILIKPEELKKDKASARETIQIQTYSDDSDLELSEQDLEVFRTYGEAASFLDNLDEKGISRGRKEIERLHQLCKPPKTPVHHDDDLLSMTSHEDDYEKSWDSEISISKGDSNTGFNDEGIVADEHLDFSSDEGELPYERIPRGVTLKTNSIPRLPIKLPDGRIQPTGARTTNVASQNGSGTESGSEQRQLEAEVPCFQEVFVGGRFGRPAVVDIIKSASRADRVQTAKEQIANICQEILADPENNLSLLRRLHNFSLEEITSPSESEPVRNDPMIRKLAILSQLAVFKDIIPGYRIRTLTEREKAEKVSQIVARTRDWEQGLVAVYQTYLRGLEAEIKTRTELADVALRCMCTLLTDATHFNFRVNLMKCIVSRLSKKSWNKSSDLCLDTVIKVFHDDLTGVASLEIVRLVNCTVKERKYNVHPEVLSCLVHLRLKKELNVRASDSVANKDQVNLHSRSKAASRRAKGKPTVQPHLSKKARKFLKEKQEITKELREAEAEVNKEERAATHTETLKLLFVLYFSILKNPRPTPLLPAALQGISKFAHLVNVDFFKDLMAVLKGLVSRDLDSESSLTDADFQTVDRMDKTHRVLLCIITGFELLTGQGEALSMDLSDFISILYAMIVPLSLTTDANTDLYGSSLASVKQYKNQSTTDLFFRALNLVFSPRSFGTTAPSVRSAAFAKRLLTVCLHWPPSAVLRTLNFISELVAKDAKLEQLLSTDDRAPGGFYRPYVDDPQLSHPFGTSLWELNLLYASHYDANVRRAAGKLLNWEAGRM